MFIIPLKCIEPQSHSTVTVSSTTPIVRVTIVGTLQSVSYNEIYFD